MENSLSDLLVSNHYTSQLHLHQKKDLPHNLLTHSEFTLPAFSLALNSQATPLHLQNLKPLLLSLQIQVPSPATSPLLLLAHFPLPPFQSLIPSSFLPPTDLQPASLSLPYFPSLHHYSHLHIPNDHLHFSPKTLPCSPPLKIPLTPHSTLYPSLQGQHAYSVCPANQYPSHYARARLNQTLLSPSHCPLD